MNDIMPTMHNPLISEIQAVVAAHFRLTPQFLLSVNRMREYVRPRQIAMYLSRQLTIQSYPAIGGSFQRDHTTVLHAVRHIERLRQFNAEVDQAIGAISQRLAHIVAERTRHYVEPEQAAA